MKTYRQQLKIWLDNKKENVQNEEDQSDDHYDGLGLKFKNPEYFYSIGELIDWFNGEYRKNLLEKIEILVEHYRYEIEQKND